eukprot:6172256-Pleurochrysis_carterae.AAC.1
MIASSAGSREALYQEFPPCLNSQAQHAFIGGGGGDRPIGTHALAIDSCLGTLLRNSPTAEGPHAFA